MSFDMEVFMAGVLTGSHATRQRHVRQAKIIQAEIAALAARDALGLAEKACRVVSRSSDEPAQ